MYQEKNSIYSSYKLHNDVVRRMVANKVTTRDGKTYPGCTTNMIAALIHFSHICSPSGYISDFRINELKDILKCSPREVYQVLKDLEEREFIKMEQSGKWTGFRHITILNNDFSKYSENDYKKNRYLNTNYDFFNYRITRGYDKFLNLSKYNMRLLIVLLHNYNYNKGYHSSYENLCNHLGIKRRGLIAKYLKEIKDLLGDEGLISEHKNEFKRLKYGSISIRKENETLNSNKQLRDYMDTYYTYHWKTKLQKFGINTTPESGISLNFFCSRISKIVHYHLKHSSTLKLDLIENIVETIITDNHILHAFVLTEIDQRLRALA